MAQINLNLSKSLFTPKAFPLITDYSHRWEVWYGGSGSSKSYSIAQKIIIRCCREKINILVCRRYGSTLRNTCFSLFKEILSKWKLTQYVKIKETDFSIQFPNGSKIIMMGLDEETKLLSLNDIGSIWIEEVFEVPKEIVEQLNLRMRSQNENQQIIMSFNPISKNHWLYDFVEVNPPKSFIKIHSTFKDNPFLSKEYIAAMEDMKERNPAKAKIYYYGEYGSNPEGVIFHNWHIEGFNHKEINGELCCGLDFGFINDATALICSILNEKEKKLYIFKEWYAKGKTNDEIAEAIQYLGLNKSTIIADSAEQKSIEEIRRKGIQKIKAASKGKGSIIQGIDKLLEYDILIHPSCTNTIVELENYSWKKDKHTNTYLNEPEDDYNHCMDALRYSLQCVTKKLKTIDKNLF